MRLFTASAGYTRAQKVLPAIAPAVTSERGPSWEALCSPCITPHQYPQNLPCVSTSFKQSLLQPFLAATMKPMLKPFASSTLAPKGSIIDWAVDWDCLHPPSCLGRDRCPMCLVADRLFRACTVMLHCQAFQIARGFLMCTDQGSGTTCHQAELACVCVWEQGRRHVHIA